VQGTTHIYTVCFPDTRRADGQHHGNRYRHGGVRDPTFALMLHRECNEFDNGYVHAAGTLSCTLPTNISTPQRSTMRCRTYGGRSGLVQFGTSNVVAEVTTAATSGGVVVFASGDKLNMNQASSAARSLASKTPDHGNGRRILVITYYLDSSVTPTRLMRQVSGHTPCP